MMRFDRFTERAQDAAARAYEILQRYGHNQVDTEHLLLALLEQPEGVIPQILNSPAWKDNGALFITFDEGEKLDGGGCCQYSQGGHIATLVISPLVPAGFRSNVGYSHYSLLRTIETAWGLAPLGKAACNCSPTMADFFAPTSAQP